MRVENVRPQVLVAEELEPDIIVRPNDADVKVKILTIEKDGALQKYLIF
jgi:hypothetical protein